jgi:hypothetical protein
LDCEVKKCVSPAKLYFRLKKKQAKLAGIFAAKRMVIFGQLLLNQQ